MDLKTIHNVTLFCIMLICFITIYLFFQVEKELSFTTSLLGENTNKDHGLYNLAKFRILTIGILILCIIQILLVRASAMRQNPGQLIQLSKVIRDMKYKKLEKQVQVTGKGPLTILEQSLEELRKQLLHEQSKVDDSQPEQDDKVTSMNKVVRGFICLLNSDSLETTFQNLGDVLSMVSPGQTYFLFLVDGKENIITSEPFITPHSNRDLMFRKCGLPLISTIMHCKEVYHWPEIIDQYISRADKDKKDLEYLKKIKNVYNPRTVYSIPMDRQRKYLLLSTLEQENPNHAENLELLKQLCYITKMKLASLQDFTEPPITSRSNVLGFKEFLVLTRSSIGTSIDDEEPLAFVIVGVDFFNTLIDTYGKNHTNELIDQLTDLILDNTLKTIQVGKLTHDIYILLATKLAKQQIFQYVETIRKLVESHLFIVGKEQVRITVSIGGTFIRKDLQENEESLLKRTRLMLEKAISSGGNRCCIDDQLLSIE